MDPNSGLRYPAHSRMRSSNSIMWSRCPGRTPISRITLANVPRFLSEVAKSSMPCSRDVALAVRNAENNPKAATRPKAAKPAGSGAAKNSGSVGFVS